jgi:hypothetical protein
VCPRNPQTKTGWKGNIDICLDAETTEEMIGCIDLNTYSLGEAIPLTYSNGEYSLIIDSDWNEIVAFLPLGKCYIQRLNAGSVGFSHDTSLTIFLNSSLEYYVMLMDPDFFLMTSNPRTIPRIMLSVKPHSEYKFVYLDMVEHVKLNTEDNPCKESPDYSFTNCIKKSCNEKIGCQTKWDKSLDSDLPMCTKKQLIKYTDEYENYQDLEQMQLVNYTNCPLPCSYKEYKLVEAPLEGLLSESGLEIMFGSGHVQVEREEETFSFESFVAECGGCLGLFLGFSFLMAWDILQIIFFKVSALVQKF